VAELGQHSLAVRLRTSIDLACRTNVPNYVISSATRRARQLALDNPRNLQSKHVRHNIGARRWQWLEERGLTVEKNKKLEEIAAKRGEVAVKGTITPNAIGSEPAPDPKEMTREMIRAREIPGVKSNTGRLGRE
jgi:hypothetical protein